MRLVLRDLRALRGYQPSADQPLIFRRLVEGFNPARGIVNCARGNNRAVAERNHEGHEEHEGELEERAGEVGD